MRDPGGRRTNGLGPSPSPGAALLALAALAFCALPARAQEAPSPAGAAAAPAGIASTPADAQSTASADSVDNGPPETPTSTEQGHVQLPDSFEHRPVAALLRESRFVGVRDTTFSAQIRSYYLEENNFNNTQSLAWTLGGSLGIKTGYFWERIALGATGYTSQRLDGPYDKDGTQLLQTGQRPYSALGELYAEARVSDEIRATAGRKALDTPYINTHDSLMTPNTFLGYALQGVVGGRDDAPTVRFGAGYIDQIKNRNSETFESMATAAGAPAGIERGVYGAGANYRAGGFSIGVTEYYSPDIINIAYAETGYAIALAEQLRLQLAAQYTDQRSTGEDLLTGKSFSTDQYGLKAELAFGAALLTVARTATGSGANMRSPWGGYPGYTSVQLQNFYRAGEDATLLRAAYNFPRVTGLSAYALYVHGSTPDAPGQYAQDEYDLNVQWKARSGTWKGLTLLARYGHVSQAGPADQHDDEVRLVVYYDIPWSR